MKNYQHLPLLLITISKYIKKTKFSVPIFFKCMFQNENFMVYEFDHSLLLIHAPELITNQNYN